MAAMRPLRFHRAVIGFGFTMVAWLHNIPLLKVTTTTWLLYGPGKPPSREFSRGGFGEIQMHPPNPPAAIGGHQKIFAGNCCVGEGELNSHAVSDFNPTERSFAGPLSHAFLLRF